MLFTFHDTVPFTHILAALKDSITLTSYLKQLVEMPNQMVDGNGKTDSYMTTAAFAFL